MKTLLNTSSLGYSFRREIDILIIIPFTYSAWYGFKLFNNANLRRLKNIVLKTTNLFVHIKLVLSPSSSSDTEVLKPFQLTNDAW